MKYKRMLCWVRPHEKKELEEAVNVQFPLVFAKNYDDFKNQINKDDYLIFSLSKAKNIKKIKSLVQFFPENKFNLYTLGEEIMDINHFKIMEEKNVTRGQYSAEHFVSNYLGEIPDLWEWSLKINSSDFSLIKNGDKLV